MKRSRRVAFNKSSQMIVVSNLSVGPHKNNIWFTQDEMDLFKLSMPFDINRIRSSISNNHILSADHIVGLEKFLSSDLTEEYRTRRDKLKKEILIESWWQKRLGYTNYVQNAERLKIISAENSEWARERAQVAAKFLEKDQEKEYMGQHLKPKNGPSQDCERFDVSISSNRVQLTIRSSLRENKRSRSNSHACIVLSSVSS